MGWREFLRKYGPAILTTVIDTAVGKPVNAPKPEPAPAPAPVPVPAPEPVAPPPVDRTAAIRQFVIDTYMHSAPQGLNRANEADISAVELADGIAKVQKYGTHALQREMYTRNGIHDDEMPSELLVNNPL